MKKAIKGQSKPCPYCRRVFTGDHYVRQFNRHVSAFRAHGRCFKNNQYDKELKCLFCPKVFTGE